MNSRPVISVFGSGDAAADSEEYAAAERVGRVLGELGYDVANGGYGGAMEAVSRGAAAAGAEVMGVPCRVWPSRVNRFVTRAIETDDLHHRLRRLIDLGTGGYVVLPGATGTLLELATVWELSAKRMLPPRPVVCVGAHWRPVADRIAAKSPWAAARVRFVTSPEELRRLDVLHRALLPHHLDEPRVHLHTDNLILSGGCDLAWRHAVTLGHDRWNRKTERLGRGLLRAVSTDVASAESQFGDG